MKIEWGINETVRAAIFAALYFGLTVVVAPIAYGPIQFRISEMLSVLPFDRKYGGFPAVVGLSTGCLLANVISPLGIADVTLGTFGTVVATVLVWQIGERLGRGDIQKVIAGITSSMTQVVIIGVILLNVIFGMPIIESVGGVFIGEIATAGVGGVLLLKALEKTYQRK